MQVDTNTNTMPATTSRASKEGRRSRPRRVRAQSSLKGMLAMVPSGSLDDEDNNDNQNMNGFDATTTTTTPPFNEEETINRIEEENVSCSSLSVSDFEREELRHVRRSLRRAKRRLLLSTVQPEAENKYPSRGSSDSIQKLREVLLQVSNSSLDYDASSVDEPANNDSSTSLSTN